VAHAGQQVENPATGERIVFVRIEDEVVEMDARWTRSGRRTGPHLHPHAEERWEVIEGRAAFRIEGAEREAGPGDIVVAPAGVPHEAWNPGAGEARVRIELRPALRWAEFVERLFAGEPPAELLAEYRDEILLA
jgi:mannose-6-phosphate isomerase-like protein (cupin superfamily)